MGFALFARPSVQPKLLDQLLSRGGSARFGNGDYGGAAHDHASWARSAQEHAGTASGINNAVSRTASLLAIAILGVVMLHAFSWGLQLRLNEFVFDEGLKQSILEQRVKLAGLEIPNGADPKLVKQVVAGAFVTGFRLIMTICAALALAERLEYVVLIGQSRPGSYPQAMRSTRPAGMRPRLQPR